MNKVALITGGAKRIGAVLVQRFHQAGFNTIIHYHHSIEEANLLANKLNEQRDASAIAIKADIRQPSCCQILIEQAFNAWGRLDVLINNASSFYPTPIGQIREETWEDLLGSNLKGPFFLSQAACSFLANTQGNIINITDIHADRPLKNYSVYSIAKAGLAMLTKSMARELAPLVRVNAVAPGVTLWPENDNELSALAKTHLIERTCLKRKGSPDDIADTALFLAEQKYITGQVIVVDGGRSIRD